SRPSPWRASGSSNWRRSHEHSLPFRRLVATRPRARPSQSRYGRRSAPRTAADHRGPDAAGQSGRWSRRCGVRRCQHHALLFGERERFQEHHISPLQSAPTSAADVANVAFLILATDGGRLRGLGLLVDGDTLHPACPHANTPRLGATALFPWLFSTAVVGDM